jgi:fructose-1,6-bisphosphatase II
MSESHSQYLGLEFVRVTEQAALAAARWIGKGDKKAADKAAVDAMREIFNKIEFRGEVVIGEGAKDDSYELYIGEKLGSGAESSEEVDIAVDPLECTSSVAFGRPNAITVIATGPRGSLYHAGDSYMKKIAAGPEAKHAIDINASPEENIKKVAQALGKDVGEVTVAILDRERQYPLIEEVRRTGARIQLFTDGDISMAVATCMPESSIDLLLGVGGSTEAVLAAAALKCLGGEIVCQWKPKDEIHIARLREAGVTDFDKIFRTDDLAKGNDIAFTATGVLEGPLALGVGWSRTHATTHTLVLSSSPNVQRVITTRHSLNHKSP